ncbi:MAG: hypothetical protein QOH21_2291 [Acidobacteriota bacterium]|jgi:hypothetical protein|nr:hypothetical protein [Acidobacteriota bacterium]
MEGRVLLRCGDCPKTREISGEIPEEYTASFALAVAEDGWVPKPGANTPSLICGDCLTKYAGHETVDDEEKVRGERDPKEP